MDIFFRAPVLPSLQVLGPNATAAAGCGGSQARLLALAAVWRWGLWAFRARQGRFAPIDYRALAADEPPSFGFQFEHSRPFRPFVNGRFPFLNCSGSVPHPNFNE